MSDRVTVRGVEYKEENGVVYFHDVSWEPDTPWHPSNGIHCEFILLALRAEKRREAAEKVVDSIMIDLTTEGIVTRFLQARLEAYDYRTRYPSQQEEK